MEEDGEEPLRPPSPPDVAATDESQTEALTLKDLAEQKYLSSDLKSALRLTKKAHRLYPSHPGLSQMFTALRVLKSPPSDHYSTLDLPPFSNINAIKKQYKSLALVLHPDKSKSKLSSSSSHFVGSEEAFKRIAEAFRVLSDRVLRKEYDLKVRVEIERTVDDVVEESVETFWTACDRCRLLHEFERKYLGQRLLCPGCRRSFIAVEVKDDGSDGELEEDVVFGVRGRASRSRSSSRSAKRKDVSSAKASVSRVLELENGGKRRKEMTLAEMQLEALRNKSKSNFEKKKKKSKSDISKVKVELKENGMRQRKGKERMICEFGEEDEFMEVEDSDFYDFDKDRTEKSFRKGEVWAIYDDDDGMPRIYGLIDEVVSTNPFRLRMSWLDLQGSGEETLVQREKMGLHVSCGRFKVGKKVEMDSVNLFSHVVCCERAARELYRIYPKKGSVWALYSDSIIAGGEDRCYDIVVVLTSYSEIHGLSMGYLVKVNGFKTIFERREIGVHAIKWLEKDDMRVLSHQIPARNLTGEEAPGLPNECWELDPASLPAIRCTSQKKDDES